MHQCYSCGADIDMGDGVTVIPAKTRADDADSMQWWHPDCRAVELRKLTTAITRKAARKPEPVGAPQDEM